MKRSKSRPKIRSTISHKQSTSPPVGLTIAGSDSSAGAGIQADLKTFNTLGVYGLSAVTCVVAEIPGKVSQIQSVEPEMVREQIRVIAKHFPIAAIKTGLLYSAEIISVVARSIQDLRRKLPLIVDPVITATGGDPLLKADAIQNYQSELFPLATLITPNLDEAVQLGIEKITDRKSMEHAVTELAGKFKTAILLKGGHLSGQEAVDLLFANGKVLEFSAPFVRGVATHGTGCIYSAAITAGLARSRSLEGSIARAKEFVTACIRDHFRWQSKSGRHIDALSHPPKEP